MGWKELPPWLKGGVFGLIISLIVWISLWSFMYEKIVFDGCHSREQPGDVYSQCDMIKYQMKSSTISAQYNAEFMSIYIFVFVIISIPLFLCGSLFGLIIGKIKSRR